MNNYKEVAASLAAEVCRRLGLDVKKHFTMYTKTFEELLVRHHINTVFEAYKNGDYEIGDGY